MTELAGRYVISSNRESGFGRYDIMLEPAKQEDCAYIIEFKVHDAESASNLNDTAISALKQIEEKCYEAELQKRGIPSCKIRKYGFAFKGKQVLIMKS